MFKVSVVAHAHESLMAAMDKSWDHATKIARAAGDTIGSGRAAAGVIIREERLDAAALPYVIAERLHALDTVLRHESGFDGMRDGGWMGSAATVIYVHPIHMHRLAAVQHNCEVVAVLHDDLLHHMDVRLVLDPTNGSLDLAWQGANSYQCAKVFWA